MNSSANPSLLGRLIGFVVMAVMLVLGLMFSVVLLAIVFVLGLGAFGYYWWKTRDLREAMHEQASSQRASRREVQEQGQVIEGEAVIVEDGERGRQTLRVSESKDERS